MKKRMIQWACSTLLVALLAASPLTMEAGNLADKRPPRPEKVQEEIPERPSEYHVWREGRWKWKKRDQEWIWKSGQWSFDSDYHQWKNFRRHGFNYGRFYRPRYLVVPIGRGLYRVIPY